MKLILLASLVASARPWNPDELPCDSCEVGPADVLQTSALIQHRWRVEGHKPNATSSQHAVGLASRGQDYDVGLYEQDEGDKECAEGKYLDPVFNTCTTCHGGETRRRRATECTGCPEGRYDASLNSDDCSECLGGETTRRRAESFQQCAEGWYNDGTLDDCQRCTQETRRRSSGSSGATKCTDCPAGKYQYLWYDDECQDMRPSCNFCVRADTGTLDSCHNYDGSDPSLQNVCVNKAETQFCIPYQEYLSEHRTGETVESCSPGSLPPMPEWVSSPECIDSDPAWVDEDGRGCEYMKFVGACVGRRAAEVCCVCGGGNYSRPLDSNTDDLWFDFAVETTVGNVDDDATIKDELTQRLTTAVVASMFDLQHAYQPSSSVVLAGSNTSFLQLQDAFALHVRARPFRGSKVLDLYQDLTGAEDSWASAYSNVAVGMKNFLPRGYDLHVPKTNVTSFASGVDIISDVVGKTWSQVYNWKDEIIAEFDKVTVSKLDRVGKIMSTDIRFVEMTDVRMPTRNDTSLVSKLTRDEISLEVHSRISFSEIDADVDNDVTGRLEEIDSRWRKILGMKFDDREDLELEANTVSRVLPKKYCSFLGGSSGGCAMAMEKRFNDGWYAGSPGESCDGACQSVGLVCTDGQLSGHNGEVDSEGEVAYHWASVAGVTCNKFDHNWGSALGVPSMEISSGRCFVSASNRDLASFQCSMSPESQKRRLCYCHKAPPPAPTPAPTPAPAKWSLLNGCDTRHGGPCDGRGKTCNHYATENKFAKSPSTWEECRDLCSQSTDCAMFAYRHSLASYCTLCAASTGFFGWPDWGVYVNEEATPAPIPEVAYSHAHGCDTRHGESCENGVYCKAMAPKTAPSTWRQCADLCSLNSDCAMFAYRHSHQRDCMLCTASTSFAAWPDWGVYTKEVNGEFVLSLSPEDFPNKTGCSSHAGLTRGLRTGECKSTTWEQNITSSYGGITGMLRFQYMVHGSIWGKKSDSMVIKVDGSEVATLHNEKGSTCERDTNLCTGTIAWSGGRTITVESTSSTANWWAHMLIRKMWFEAALVRYHSMTVDSEVEGDWTLTFPANWHSFKPNGHFICFKDKKLAQEDQLPAYSRNSWQTWTLVKKGDEATLYCGLDLVKQFTGFAGFILPAGCPFLIGAEPGSGQHCSTEAAVGLGDVEVKHMQFWDRALK